MRNWKILMLMLILPAAILSVQSAFGQSPQPQKSSAESSRRSGTGAGSERSEISNKQSAISNKPAAAGGQRSAGVWAEQGLINSCAAVVEELKAARVLIEKLDAEAEALRERLETEKRQTELLRELNETRKSEAAALVGALEAKNQTIAAKDAVIGSQEKLIETLKRKKSSPWKRVLDVLVGVGVGVILK